MNRNLKAPAQMKRHDQPPRLITFTTAQASDAEALVALRIAAMQESLERIARFDPVRARERFISTFAPEHTRHIVAAGDRVGFVVLKPEPDCLLLDHLYIRPNAQGKGIGTAVLAYVFAEADAGALPVRVGALRESDSNRFYLRHGFQIVEQSEFDNTYVRPCRQGTSVEIRTLSPTDADLFQALRLQGLRECPTAFASSFAEEQADSGATVAQRLSPKNDGAILGAFQGNKLVGILGIQRERMTKLAHKAFIWGVYVAPSARQSHVGTALMERALKYAAEALAVRQVNLGVNTKNEAALALYRKLGFIEYGCERGYLLVDGGLHDEYHMVCHVCHIGRET